MKTRILVIPGIGDIHWVALKLRSFCEQNGITDPELHIWNLDDRPRSLDFVRRLPMCSAGEYWDYPLNNRYRSQFNDVYLYGRTDCIEGFAGFDYLLCVNGSLRMGKEMIDGVLPGCAVEWDYPLLQSVEEVMYEDVARAIGPYLLLYFSDNGMFSHWLRAWNISAIVTFIQTLQRAMPERKLILTGSAWDRPFANRLSEILGTTVENRVGETSLDQFLALVRNAEGFVGWCGGNTILATHLGIPVCMLWSTYFEPGFFTNWVKPDRINNTYWPILINHADPTQTALRCAENIERCKVAAAV